MNSLSLLRGPRMSNSMLCNLRRCFYQEEKRQLLINAIFEGDWTPIMADNRFFVSNTEEFFEGLVALLQGVCVFENSKPQTPWKNDQYQISRDKKSSAVHVLVNRKRILLTLICMTSIVAPSWEFSSFLLRQLHSTVKHFCHCSYRIRSCRLCSCFE